MSADEIVKKLRDFCAHESNEFFGNDLPAQVYQAAMEAADLIEKQAKALGESQAACKVYKLEKENVSLRMALEELRIKLIETEENARFDQTLAETCRKHTEAAEAKCDRQAKALVAMVRRALDGEKRALIREEDSYERAVVAEKKCKQQAKELEDEQAANRECWKKIYMLRGVIDDVEKALIFYADPFSAVDEHGEAVGVPDFYSELSFGDIASAALATIRAVRGEGR